MMKNRFLITLSILSLSIFASCVAPDTNVEKPDARPEIVGRYTYTKTGRTAVSPVAGGVANSTEINESGGVVIDVNKLDADKEQVELRFDDRPIGLMATYLDGRLSMPSTTEKFNVTSTVNGVVKKKSTTETTTYAPTPFVGGQFSIKATVTGNVEINGEVAETISGSFDLILIKK